MPKIKHRNHAAISKILNLRLAVLLSNIIFQGIRYMSLGEKIYKIAITLLFALLINIFLQNVMLSIVTGHFLNYIFNGQYYVVFRYLSSKRTMSKKDLEEFIILIERLMIKEFPEKKYYYLQMMKMNQIINIWNNILLILNIKR